MPTKKKESWKNSAAKQLLKDDIINGVVKEGMKPKEVYTMHDEYKKWPQKNFGANLRSLRKKIDKDKEHMAEDEAAYRHDLQLLKKLRQNDSVDVPWHRSEASALLKQDVRDGRHKVMKPIELYHSRQEYQHFELTTFRNHIYQQVDEKAKRDSRYAKKKLRAMGKPPKAT